MKKSKSMCSGCRDNFYNRNRAEGCWSFANATIKQRMIVGTFENPPYDKKRLGPKLSCYNPDGMSIIEAGDCRIKERETA